MQEALLLSGAIVLPSAHAQAREFVRGPLRSALAARVGPTLADHWLDELVRAVDLSPPVSIPARKPRADVVTGAPSPATSGGAEHGTSSAAPRFVAQASARGGMGDRDAGLSVGVARRTGREVQAKPSDPHTPVETAIDPWLGRVLDGRYRLLQKAEDGARGVLYRAERVSDGVRLGVKLVAPALHQAKSVFEERFDEEARLARSLSHPHTLVVYDHGRADEHKRYMACEWLSGIDLRRMWESRGPLNARQAMYLAHQVCRSLAHAHAHGVVHADLSPEGIFVARQPGGVSVVKVMDYGRRRVADFNDEGHSQIGLPRGWARYLAPEQITGADYDHRVDVYALGVILYEALSGTLPFPDSTAIGILMSQVNDRPAPLRGHEAARQIPEAVETLVMRCLEKDPDRRFADSEELVRLTAALSS